MYNFLSLKLVQALFYVKKLPSWKKQILLIMLSYIFTKKKIVMFFTL